MRVGEKSGTPLALSGDNQNNRAEIKLGSTEFISPVCQTGQSNEKIPA
jgi:hypothetical protein